MTQEGRSMPEVSSSDTHGATAASSGDQRGGEIRLPKLDTDKRTPQETAPRRHNAWCSRAKDTSSQKGSKKGKGKEMGRAMGKEREEKDRQKTDTPRKAHPQKMLALAISRKGRPTKGETMTRYTAEGANELGKRPGQLESRNARPGLLEGDGPQKRFPE